MSNTKRRHLLYENAKDSWGTETAEALMDFLPPEPDHFATTADLVVIGSDLRVEMAQLGGALRSEMAQQTRTLVLALVTIEVTILLAVLGVALTA